MLCYRRARPWCGLSRAGFKREGAEKMSLFSEALNEDRELEHKVCRGGIANMLDLMPDEFSREECRSMRIQQGKRNPNPKDQLAQWTKRGFIVYREDTKKYQKTQKYLSSHAA